MLTLLLIHEIGASIVINKSSSSLNKMKFKESFIGKTHLE